MFLIRVITAFTMSNVICIILKKIVYLTKSVTAFLLTIASALAVSVNLPLNFADKVSERLVMLMVSLMTTTGLLLMAVRGFLRYYDGISILIAGTKSLVLLSRRIVTFACREAC